MLDSLFRSAISPWQWTLLALIPPAIIALYFLKLKRMPLEVPSTYLWKKSLEDMHVNSLWQRLRKSLLLLLQLILVALAILSLLRPGWEGTELLGQRFIFLVDNSASMSATDVADVESRLEAAKQQTRDLVDQMESGMTAMIISFAGTPRVVQEFTDNRQLLRDRLASIQPTNGTTDLKGALDLADGLANPERVPTEGQGDLDLVEPQPATVYLFSDGRFEEVQDFSLGNLEPVYVPIGSFTAQNLAITAFSTRRGEVRPEQRQAFLRLENFSDQQAEARIILELDGQFLDARDASLAAGESSSIVFDLPDAPPGKLTARLTYVFADESSQDVLSLDDTAHAALNEPRAGRVLVVSPGNPVLASALSTERMLRLAEVHRAYPDVLEKVEHQQEVAAGTYDLVIYDQCVPVTMPQANTLFIGRLPPGPAWRGDAAIASAVAANGEGGAVQEEDEPAPDPAEARVDTPIVLDWDKAHPMLANMELGQEAILDSMILDPPPGGDVLIESTDGPVLAIAPRDSFEDAVLGFELIRDVDGSTAYVTNWPKRLSFPTFWINVAEYLGGQMDEGFASQVQPGKTATIRAEVNSPEIEVVAPDGTTKEIARGQQSIVQYHDTQQLGVYEVRQRDEVVDRFAVNLFDRDESNVRLTPSQVSEAEQSPAAIRIGHVEVEASGRMPARKEIWKLILLAALCVLLLEWYIYNRRVYL